VVRQFKAQHVDNQQLTNKAKNVVRMVLPSDGDQALAASRLTSKLKTKYNV
jgi:hypothetical protein